MMRFVLVLIALFGFELLADRVKETMTVCSEETTINELTEYTDTKKMAEDGLDLELWLMKHSCKVIDNKTQIEVLDYTGKKKEIVKIKLKQSGEIVFGLSKAIEIEQPGQKNIIYKF